MTNGFPGSNEPDHVVVPPKVNAGKLDYTYIVGGILLLGLIGWGLDNLLHTAWILYASLPVGVVSGYFLARHHQRHSRRDDAGQQ